MKRFGIVWCFSMLLVMSACQHGQTSPDGTLSLQPTATGFALSKSTDSGIVNVIEIPSVGLTTANGRGVGLTFKHIRHRSLDAHYTMLTGKRRECSNSANEYTYTYADSTGAEVRMVFRLYNDGLAFRYEIDGLIDDLVTDEFTTYRIEEGRQRWIQKFDLGYEQFSHPHTTPDPNVKVEVPDKILGQIVSTDMTKAPHERMVKQFERSGLADAMAFGMIQLERYNRK